MKTYNQSLREAMSMEEISEAQSDHYTMDDYFRRNMGKLTIEEKRKVLNLMESFISKEA